MTKNRNPALTADLAAPLRKRADIFGFSYKGIGAPRGKDWPLSRKQRTELRARMARLCKHGER